jgi:DNA repair exonuclease SbcCD ATPase subunit
MRRLVLLLAIIALALPSVGADSFAYIYRQPGGATHIRNYGNSIETMVARSKRWSGEYVWLERSGRQYLIRDASVLAEVRAAFAEMHAFEPKVRAAKDRLRPLEDKLDQLEEQIEAHEDEARSPQGEALRKQFRELEPRYQAAERESERLEDEHERLEEIAEARFGKIVRRALRDGKAQRVH